jgi:hypothetical protein
VLTSTVALVGSVVAVLTAVVSFGTSRKAHALSERTAHQQHRRGRSEETMRLLRWAVELAVEPDVRRSLAGTAALAALTDAHLVVLSDRSFVRAVAGAVMTGVANLADYSEYGEPYVDPGTGGQHARK